MALGEVDVSLPWWCHALVLLPPGYWRLFLNLKNLFIMKFQWFYLFYLVKLKVSTLTYGKISNLEPERQGRGIIMGETRLLPQRPFYTIQTKFMYCFAHDCIMWPIIFPSIWLRILPKINGEKYPLAPYVPPGLKNGSKILPQRNCPCQNKWARKPAKWCRWCTW